MQRAALEFTINRADRLRDRPRGSRRHRETTMAEQRNRAPRYAKHRAARSEDTAEYAHLKLATLGRAGRDDTLSKAALRLLIVLCDSFLNFDTGKVAYASAATYSKALGYRPTKSNSSVRDALDELEGRGYLTCERVEGKTSRYRLVEKKKGGQDTAPEIEAGAVKTPPENGAGSEGNSPPEIEAGSPPQSAAHSPPGTKAPTPPQSGAPIPVEDIPGEDHPRKSDHRRAAAAGGAPLRRAPPSSSCRSLADFDWDEDIPF